MKFKTKFIINLHKSYFEKGLQITTYLKYLVALFSLYSIVEKMHPAVAVSAMLGYAFGCYFLGLLWFKYGFFEAEIEVGNYFNKFVNEMRQKFGSPKKGKIFK